MKLFYTIKGRYIVQISCILYELYQMRQIIFFRTKYYRYVLFIRCVEPIIYNEHVVSFRQKTLKHCSFAAELINNFVAAV